MKYKKYKGFTLAELMVILAVGTILLAAMAPVFTSRYRISPLDYVWHLVGNDEFNDLYSDAPNKSMLQTVFIGASPVDGFSVKSDYYPYSKLIIRSSDAITSEGEQRQIEFRYNDDKENRSYLFANSAYDFLFGAKYYNIGDNARYNTSYGSLALDNITTGSSNTALGYNALGGITNRSNNTAIGYNALSNDKILDNNTYALYNPASRDSYSTIIGSNISNISSFNTRFTTVVGSYASILSNFNANNTAVGAYSVASGGYSTAIGYSSGVYNKTGEYNTFVGTKRQNFADGDVDSSSFSFKNKTFIGNVMYNDSNVSSSIKSYMNDDTERIFIGGPVSKYNSASVVEVHNPSGNSTNGLKINGSVPQNSDLGNTSVVINGNLIIRGQSFFAGTSKFPTTSNTLKPALMGYYLSDSTVNNAVANVGSNFKVLTGDDGTLPTKRLYFGEKSVAQVYDGYEHCMCTYSEDNNDLSGITSYDWSSYNTNSVSVLLSGTSPNNYLISPDYNDPSKKVIELNKAHGLANFSNSSCCPILTNDGQRVRIDDSDSVSRYSTSDIRLKNLGEPFNDGLNKLSKLKIYNYTFKSDKNKIPHVGVIAQDLKRVFKNAVSKNIEGYYEIRVDEMFFTAINSVKELYSKYLNLKNRVASDIERINNLKKENKALLEKLDSLSAELSKLESK